MICLQGRGISNVEHMTLLPANLLPGDGGPLYLRYLLIGSRCDNVELLAKFLSDHGLPTSHNLYIGQELSWHIGGPKHCGEYSNFYPWYWLDRGSYDTKFKLLTLICTAPMHVHCYTHPNIAVDNYIKYGVDAAITETEYQLLIRYGYKVHHRSMIDRAVDYVITWYNICRSVRAKRRSTLTLDRELNHMVIEDFCHLSGIMYRPMEVSVIEPPRVPKIKHKRLERFVETICTGP